MSCERAIKQLAPPHVGELEQSAGSHPVLARTRPLPEVARFLVHSGLCFATIRASCKPTHVNMDHQMATRLQHVRATRGYARAMRVVTGPDVGKLAVVAVAATPHPGEKVAHLLGLGRGGGLQVGLEGRRCARPAQGAESETRDASGVACGGSVRRAGGGSDRPAPFDLGAFKPAFSGSCRNLQLSPFLQEPMGATYRRISMRYTLRKQATRWAHRGAARNRSSCL